MPTNRPSFTGQDHILWRLDANKIASRAVTFIASRSDVGRLADGNEYEPAHKVKSGYIGAFGEGEHYKPLKFVAALFVPLTIFLPLNTIDTQMWLSFRMAY